MGPMAVLWLAAAAGDMQSVYTELSEAACVVIPAVPDAEDEGGLRCKGPAGYELLTLSGDLRATVTVVAPDGQEHPLEFWDVITGGFSTLGPRAEWRVGEDGLPRAVIVRVSASEDPDDPERKTSYLAVAKITPGATCVTDRIVRGADDNVRARVAADTAAGRPCLGALAQ